jgi:opacity protein-like surface antigen
MITKAFSTILLTCWLMAASTFALAAEVTVSQILSNPAAFDGQHVTVSGTAQYVRSKTSRSGNDYETFSLCQQACVNVFTWGQPSVAEGKSLTVNGTFQAVKHVGRYTFRNESDADEGSL